MKKLVKAEAKLSGSQCWNVQRIVSSRILTPALSLICVLILACSFILGCSTDKSDRQTGQEPISESGIDANDQDVQVQADLNGSTDSNDPSAFEPEARLGKKKEIIQTDGETGKGMEPVQELDETQKGKIRNPYFAKPVWKLWLSDKSVVNVSGRRVPPIAESARLYPVLDSTKPFQFSGQNPGHSCAGFHDDVYVNLDNRHSWLPHEYVIGDHRVEFKRAVNALEKVDLRKVGANYTSQSTTGMGSNLANNEQTMTAIEKEFYFANIILCGPTHNSYTERYVQRPKDSYQALVPTYFNSIGSSSSEVHAIAKMMIAGAYLDRDLKENIKRLGLYAPTMLYIWKAALPLGVEYEHPLRHRVAYMSYGERDQFNGAVNFNVNFEFHQYDEEEHIRAMVEIAQNLKEIPPVTMMELVDCQGGEIVYDLFSSSLIHQAEDQTVVEVSLQKSFELNPHVDKVSYRVLSGSPATRIEPTKDPHVFRITIPGPNEVPRGRTSVAFFASGSGNKGNPAILNVYHAKSKRQNNRPQLPRLDRQTVALGQSKEIKFEVSDSENHNFEVTVVPRHLGTYEEGKLTLHADKKVGQKTVRVIAMDTFGAANSIAIALTTTAIPGDIKIALDDDMQAQFQFAVDPKSTAAKLTDVIWRWELGDGKTTRQQSPTRQFSHPGIYRIRLAIEESNRTSQFEKTVAVGTMTKKDVLLDDLAERNGVEVDPKTQKVHFQKMAGKSRYLLKDLPDGSFEMVCEMASLGDCRGGGFLFGNYLLGFGKDLKNDRNNRYLTLAPLDHQRKVNGQLLVKRIQSEKSQSILHLFVGPRRAGKRSLSGSLRNELGTGYFQLEVDEFQKVELETGSKGKFRLGRLSVSH